MQENQRLAFPVYLIVDLRCADERRPGPKTRKSGFAFRIRVMGETAQDSNFIVSQNPFITRTADNTWAFLDTHQAVRFQMKYLQCQSAAGTWSAQASK